MIKSKHILIALLILCGCSGRKTPAPAGGIISTAPNITEMVYALGLEDQLTAVTAHCTYPESAVALPKIGGYFEINYEAILSLQPALVLILEENTEAKARIAKMGFQTLEIGTGTITDIFQSLEKIGAACGAEERATEIVSNLRKKISNVRKQADAMKEQPRVLLVFGRDPAADNIGTVYAIGSQSIHHEMLEIAGGENAYTSRLPSAAISAEGILRINPDVIIDMLPNIGKAADLSAWQKLPSVSAVKNSRVTALTGDYVCIPGPRFIQTLEDIAKIIWQNNFEGAE
ncbi:MAG: ABC transporter substrate-binding protein [Kiritimatiellales bacterium]|nr:ABC transporter substrate-binding protein [Kiritimatiellales bacterium]